MADSPAQSWHIHPKRVAVKQDSPGVTGLSGPTISVVVVVGGKVVVGVGADVVGVDFEPPPPDDDPPPPPPPPEVVVVALGAVVVGEVLPFFMNTTVT